ncbi:hypothetical protein Rhe02_10160 [Rhizocola hellebori]|uniref:Uncharacterized protein n=2 Tax=Rhizocola hellebori TaxID=1392758 RepID=A0A8J3VCV7_9ACTN|nr:hypothetical protein Rhe02_10160 [Rhizocola hellebori]
MCLGLLLLAGSYVQLLFPRHMFTDPEVFFQGYPIVPGNLLGGAAALSALGLILFGEGVCERLGAPCLSGLVSAGPRGLVRVLVAAAAAGLAMELMAQWLGKLWVYPYWTQWFYWLVLLPGFVFYWAAIVESYLAAKAFLDWMAQPRSRALGGPPSWVAIALLGVAGALLLGVAGWRYLAWYSERGGYVFAVTKPLPNAPPFGYVLLAFVGAVLLAEWGLHARGLPSLIGSARRAYWMPLAAVAVSSVLVSLFVEGQNAVNRFWAYTHFPAPGFAVWGVPVTVFAAWPWQYLIFLLVASLFGPGLANLFWRAPGESAR